MADTPRVTVPVEPTPLSVCRAIAPYLGAIDQNDWRGLDDDDAISMPVKMRVGDLRDLKAVISAAPAPGGTVRYRHKKRETDYTLIGVGRAQGELQDDDPVVLYRGDDGGLWVRHQVEFCDGRFEELAALAAREEAPAKVGEYQAGEFIGRQPALCQHGSTDPNNLCDYCEGVKVWPGRAQPQAREDAQPVAKPAPFNPGGIGHAMYQAFHAYHADYVLSTDGADYEPTPFERDLIEDFFAGLMAEEAFFGPICALYDTHPAPDALRVAVEALDEMADTDPDDGTAWFHDRIERACREIAALQAEQKGGA